MRMWLLVSKLMLLMIAADGLIDEESGYSLPPEYLLMEETGSAYKLNTHALNWLDAKKSCEAEVKGSHLAVPNSLLEFKVLQAIVRGMKYQELVNADYKLVVWLGASNLNDYTVWTTVKDESITVAGFDEWGDGSEDHYYSGPMEPHCAGIDAVNPGYRDWWCRQRLAYICEYELTQT